METGKPAIHFDKPLETNLSRLLAFYLREALKQLASSPPKASNIHEARLFFKRSRSLIRMARFGMEKDESRQFETFFRDQGRTLSALRDAEVILEVLKPIIREVPAGEEHTLLTRFRAKLMDQRKKMQDKVFFSEAPKEVDFNLSRMQEYLSFRNNGNTSSVVFLHGARVSYSACRKRLKGLKKGQNDPRWHDWRKAVKFFWYQVELLANLWPLRFDALVLDLKSLSQALGRHHDLVLLETALHSFAGPKTKDSPKITLTLIREEKTRIESSAFLLGQKLFALTGSCFYQEMKTCIEAEGFSP